MRNVQSRSFDRFYCVRMTLVGVFAGGIILGGDLRFVCERLRFLLLRVLFSFMGDLV